jgi:hypothetical protein
MDYKKTQLEDSDFSVPPAAPLEEVPAAAPAAEEDQQIDEILNAESTATPAEKAGAMDITPNQMVDVSPTSTGTMDIGAPGAVSALPSIPSTAPSSMDITPAPGSPEEQAYAKQQAGELFNDAGLRLSDRTITEAGKSGFTVSEGSVVPTSDLESISGMTSLARGFTSMATLDSNDETVARYLSNTTGIPYETIFHKLDLEKRKAQAANPDKFFYGQVGGGATVAGGMLLGEAILLKVPGLAPLVAGMGPASRIAVNGVLSSIESAMSSPATISEHPEDVATRAAGGLVTGLTVGAGGEAISRFASSAVRRVSKTFSNASMEAIEDYTKRWKAVDKVDPNALEQIQVKILSLFKEIEDDIFAGNVSLNEGTKAISDATSSLKDIKINQDTTGKFAKAFVGIKDKISKLSDEAVTEGLKGKTAPVADLLDPFDDVIKAIPGAKGFPIDTQKKAIKSIEGLQNDIVTGLANKLKPQFPNSTDQEIISAIVSGQGADKALVSAARTVDAETIKGVLSGMRDILDGAYAETGATWGTGAEKEAAKKLYRGINSRLSKRFKKYDELMVPVRSLRNFQDNISNVFSDLGNSEIDTRGPIPYFKDNQKVFDIINNIAKNMATERKKMIVRMGKESGVDLIGAVENYRVAQVALEDIKNGSFSDEVLVRLLNAEKSAEGVKKFYQMVPPELRSDLDAISSAVSAQDVFDKAAQNIVELSKKYSSVTGKKSAHDVVFGTKEIPGLQIAAVSPHGAPTQGLSNLLERLGKYKPESRIIPRTDADMAALEAVAKFDNSGSLGSLRSDLEDIALRREFSKVAPVGAGQQVAAQAGGRALAGEPGAFLVGAVARMSDGPGGNFARLLLRNYMRTRATILFANRSTMFPVQEHLSDSASQWAMDYWVAPGSPEHQELTQAIKNDPNVPATKKIVSLRAIKNGFNAKDFFTSKVGG